LIHKDISLYDLCDGRTEATNLGILMLEIATLSMSYDGVVENENHLEWGRMSSPRVSERRTTSE